MIMALQLNYQVKHLMKLKTSQQYTSLQTIRKIGHLRAIGRTYLNGISTKYDQSIPVGLSSILSKKQLDKYLTYLHQLNVKVNQYWPCNFSYYCGYVCAPLTFGLSLFIPLVCIRQAEDVLRRDILNQKKLEMRLVKQCCDSALVIEEIDFNEFEVRDGVV